MLVLLTASRKQSLVYLLAPVTSTVTVVFSSGPRGLTSMLTEDMLAEALIPGNFAANSINQQGLASTKSFASKLLLIEIAGCLQWLMK